MGEGGEELMQGKVTEKEITKRRSVELHLRAEKLHLPVGHFGSHFIRLFSKSASDFILKNIVKKN